MPTIAWMCSIFLQRRIYLPPLTCAQRDGLGRFAVTGEASTSVVRNGETNEHGTRRASLSTCTPDVLLLAGGSAPNSSSFATLISLLDIGLPPRTCAIMLYASLAILARRIPFALTAALFLCLLAFDMAQTLSLMFGLAPTAMMAALDQARRIHFFASPLYLFADRRLHCYDYAGRASGVPEPAQRAGTWPRLHPVRAGALGLRRA